MSLSFEMVDYSVIEPWRKQAARDHVRLFEGKSPITWFLGRIDGEPFGCIGLLDVGIGQGRVRARYVLPEYRDKGLGHYLLAELMEYAKSQDYYRIERTTRRWEVGVKEGWQVVKHYSPEVGTTIEKYLE